MCWQTITLVLKREEYKGKIIVNIQENSEIVAKEPNQNVRLN
jgi:hypothetical protein